MSTSSDASNCPIIPQCCQPISGYNYQQTNFISAEMTANCPNGSIGGPFKVQAGAFYSDISQADADAKAVAFLNTLVASGCVYPIPGQVHLVFEALSSTPALGVSTLMLSIDGGTATPIVPSFDYIVTTGFSISGQLILSDGGNPVNIIEQYYTMTVDDNASITFNTGTASFSTVLGSSADNIAGTVVFSLFAATDAESSGTSLAASNSLDSPLTLAGPIVVTGHMASGAAYGTSSIIMTATLSMHA